MAQASRKARKKAVPRQTRHVPGWVWLFAGLGIGLSIALFTAMKDRAKHPAPPPPTASASPLPAQTKMGAAKPDDKKSPKPKFDFYTILPEMEVIVPDAHTKGGKGGANDKPGTYILQVGSFRSFGEADNLKAQLALLGVESKIELVTGNSGEPWHRVRVGPTQDLRELNKIRTRLINNNISTILLRIKG
jgi:cell division protein FtsN